MRTHPADKALGVPSTLQGGDEFLLDWFLAFLTDGDEQFLKVCMAVGKPVSFNVACLCQWTAATLAKEMLLVPVFSTGGEKL